MDTKKPKPPIYAASTQKYEGLKEGIATDLPNPKQHNEPLSIKPVFRENQIRDLKTAAVITYVTSESASIKIELSIYAKFCIFVGESPSFSCFLPALNGKLIVFPEGNVLYRKGDKINNKVVEKVFTSVIMPYIDFYKAHPKLSDSITTAEIQHMSSHGLKFCPKKDFYIAKAKKKN